MAGSDLPHVGGPALPWLLVWVPAVPEACGPRVAVQTGEPRAVHVPWAGGAHLLEGTGRCLCVWGECCP